MIICDRQSTIRVLMDLDVEVELQIFLASVRQARDGKMGHDVPVGTGGHRFCDPLALRIAHLIACAERLDSNTSVCCLAGGGAKHHTAVTRSILLGEGIFSPLAFSNRSLNAVAGQVAQLCGFHGPAYSLQLRDLSASSIGYLEAAAAMSEEPKIVICGGTLPTGSALVDSLYGEGQNDEHFVFAFVCCNQSQWSGDTWAVEMTNSSKSGEIPRAKFNPSRQLQIWFHDIEESIYIPGGFAGALDFALLLTKHTVQHTLRLIDQKGRTCIIAFRKGENSAC